MNDHRLLELVRQHEEIFDSSGPKNFKRHKLIWENIGRQLGKSPSACINRLRCITSASSSRNLRSSTRNFAGENDGSSQKLQVSHATTPTSEINVPEDLIMVQNISDVENSNPRYMHGSEIMEQTQVRAPPVEDSSVQDTVLQQKGEDIDTFLACIAITLKKLSPKNLNAAKRQIFNIVQDRELVELQRGQNR